MVQTNTTLLGPIAWGASPTLTAAPVLPPNPTRTGLIFINQGSVALAIAPAVGYVGAVTINSATGQYVTPALSALVPAISGAGSITMQPNDKFIIDNLNCTGAWNAVAAAATGGALTILEMQ